MRFSEVQWRCWLILAAAAFPGAAAAQSTFRGIVIDERGDPIRHAEVAIAKLMLRASVGPAGEFAFTTIPGGRFTVLTRAVGFEPDARELSFNGRDSLLLEIRLRAAAQQLDSITATAEAPRPLSAAMRGFEERRKAGFGRFLTRAELRKREHSSFTNVLRMVAGLRFVRRPEACGGGFAVAVNRGGDVSWQPWMTCYGGTPFTLACYLSIYVDGVRVWTWGSKEPPNVESFSVNAFEGIEVYRGPAELPVQYQATGSACGAMLLWSRTGESP